IGLVLSSPMTVCLVSLSRYVPQLEFLWVLLGDGPPLEPPVRFYQRLLARDESEAADLIREKVDSDGVDAVYDAMLIPALRAAKRNYLQRLISDADLAFTLATTKAMTADLGNRGRALRDRASSAPDGNDSRPAITDPPVLVVGCAGHGEGDRLALLMLTQ